MALALQDCYGATPSAFCCSVPASVYLPGLPGVQARDQAACGIPTRGNPEPPAPRPGLGYLMQQKNYAFAHAFT